MDMLVLPNNVPRLLVAASGPGIPVMRHVWRDHAELRCALYMEDARRELLAPTDIVLCTLHFHESSMFDLLRHAQAAQPRAPFICCRVRETKLRRAAIEAARLAAIAHGAVAYVDLPALQQRHGCTGGERLFREEVLRHWVSSGVRPVP
jgi:hypothetical protein